MKHVKVGVFCIAVVAMLCYPAQGWAQELSTAQLQLIKAEIAADATLAAKPMTTAGHTAIAQALNLPNSVEHWVWRTDVSREDILFGRGPDGTMFTWADNGFIKRSLSDILAWQELTGAGSIDVSVPGVRAALSEIFSGTGNAGLNRTHVFSVGRRVATRAERVLAVGTGVTTAPSTMTFEGDISPIEVEQARLLP